MHKTKIIPYLFILPFFVFFVIFKLIPVIITLVNGILEIDETSIVFIKNVELLLLDQVFFKTLLNTIIICILYVVIKIPMVIVISNLVNHLKHKRLILMMLYAPTIVGMYAYAILFRYLFTHNGFINQQLNLFGIQIDWFGNPFFAQLMIALTLLWGTLGFYILIYNNGLKNIPKELIDVIKLESNSKLPKLKYLQLPILAPVIKSILFIAILEVLTLVDLPLNLTLGGPSQSTITLSYYIYMQAIQYNNFAYASFIGIIISILSLALFLTKKNMENFKYEVI